MSFHKNIPTTPDMWLRSEFPDEALIFFDPAKLQDAVQEFQAGFPGLVTYAVKANSHPEVLAALVDNGITAFDVASPEEMRLVRQALPNARLHYHNPIRSLDEIATARLYGVSSWSIDRISELDKLGDISGAEIAVRFKLPVEGAAYDFGSKFGATPDEAVHLLKCVTDRGAVPSLTFHPGTQCHDAEAWVSYIAKSAEIAAGAGVTLERLNVGGGFPAHRCNLRPDIQGILKAISKAVHDSFAGTPPHLVCEPGRSMVSEAFTLALRVKAIGPDAVYLNDGIYGALNEWKDLGSGVRIEWVPAKAGKQSRESSAKIVFGPTCDSLDRLPEPVLLPSAIAEGDYLLIHGMGAYSLAQATRFNGYGTCNVVTLHRSAGQGI